MKSRIAKSELKLPEWAKAIFETDYQTPWWQPAYAYATEGAYMQSTRSLTGVGH